MVISSALVVDAGVVTLYANSKQDEKSEELLQSYCLRKYNTEVNDLVISTKEFKVDHERRRIKYYENIIQDLNSYVADSTLKSNIAHIGCNCEIEIMIKKILQKFENNFFVI